VGTLKFVLKRSDEGTVFFRYGIWYRLEMGATGASANTKNILPVNIPVLESSGNVAHSNGTHSYSESSLSGVYHQAILFLCTAINFTSL
jgi:hypothetical protein